MRARDKGAADLGRIPAGHDAQAERFFFFDMAWREILHRVLSLIVQISIERGAGAVEPESVRTVAPLAG